MQIIIGLGQIFFLHKLIFLINLTQMDNCGRENKNRYVFSYLSYLVQCGLFKEIRYSFLSVGHTHFDPDATTKLTTQGISGINVITIEDLHESIKKSVKNLLHIEHVLGFPNFSKLTKIDGFCNGLVGNILFLLK